MRIDRPLPQAVHARPPTYKHLTPSPTTVVIPRRLRIPKALQERIALDDLSDDAVVPFLFPLRLVALEPPSFPSIHTSLLTTDAGIAGHCKMPHEDLHRFRFTRPGLPADEDALVLPILGQACERYGAVGGGRRTTRGRG